METIQEISLTVNENADRIRAGLKHSRENALEFIAVCQASGFFIESKVYGNGEKCSLDDCPDEIVKGLAVLMFERYRKEIMN